MPREIDLKAVGQLDLLVHPEFHAPPRGLRSQAVEALPDLPVGPTFEDLDTVLRRVRKAVHELRRPLRVGAYGGARVLASVALATAVGERRLDDDEAVATLRADTGNWIGIRHRKRELVSEIVFVPATLLAVQASPARTWICNDPGEESTFWASNQSLVANAVCLDCVQAMHGIAIIAGVLLECVVGNPITGPGSAMDAQERASTLLDELELTLASGADLQALARLAYASREECENVIGPDMPGLALKQAVERVLSKYRVRIDADCIAAWFIPDVCAALLRDSSRFAVFRRLRTCYYPSRPQISSAYFREIAKAAAYTTLARRCRGATVDFYEAVLAPYAQVL